MKRIILNFISIFFILGITCNCGSVKKIAKNEYIHIEDTESNIVDSIVNKKIDSICYENKKLETYISSYKDSLIYIKGLLENSKNIVRDSSFLETSYAISTAKILESGFLEHSLKNKDSIPSKIIIIRTQSTNKEESNFTNYSKQDSIKISEITNTNIKSDICNKEEIKEKTSFWNNIKYILLGIIIGFCICLLKPFFGKLILSIFTKI